MAAIISTAPIQSQQHCFLTAHSAAVSIADMEKPQRKMTQADIDASDRLKKLWDAEQDNLGLTQEQAAEKIEVSQSAFNQMLRGKMAIPCEAALKLAALFGVHISEIRPELAPFVDAAALRNPLDQIILDFVKAEKKNVRDLSLLFSPEHMGKYANFVTTVTRDMAEKRVKPDEQLPTQKKKVKRGHQ